MGWGAAADQASNLWTTGAQSVTSERTYYAIWKPVPMSLDGMTGHGAMGINGIINFTTTTGGGGGGTGATDYTYSIVGDAVKDGVTVAVKADGTGFEVSGTPALKTTGLKADNSYDIVFNVKAVSKINGQEATATITINVEPTYHVVYDLNKPTTGTTTPADAPEDN